MNDPLTKPLEPDTGLATWRPRFAALAASGTGGDGAHDANHLERVWRNAQALLEHHPEADALVVMAACYLHDLVNLPKDDPDRAQASRRSAKLARHQLAWMNFPPERLGAVAHAIEAHSFSANIPAESLEARIVQDADRLDALGAVGLARMFYTAGRMGSSLAHPGDPLAASRPLDDRAYSLDHIAAKLATLPGKMQTEAGRKLGQERLAMLESFRTAFAAEWGDAKDS
ncbi:HD domain-containing protein [Massilia sp. ML15P13]|uniref:HD domain-containing protein n=1 Tax=Telluria aromaticivorans TaxID=2725995 RepID=A0A7Y2JYA4_9BURK|nr:HD domain-containing protein [Telluria aromaticivorans]NNG23250.1 HD domain-containing protein [Telluria aromaticivorans]